MTPTPPTKPAPASILPDQYFRTLCQNPKCRAPLGGFHVPQVGATILYACHRCRNVSIFRVDTHQITTQLQDPKGRVLT